MKLKNLTQQTILAQNVIVAKSFKDRLIGLIKYDSLSPEETLWIENCNSIHTCFMQFSIHALFVNKKLVVQKIYKNLKPWRFIFPVWTAHSVFEFASNTSKEFNIQVGDQLYVGD